jgi:hypothetical protein
MLAEEVEAGHALAFPKDEPDFGSGFAKEVETTIWTMMVCELRRGRMTSINKGRRSLGRPFG